MAKCKQGDDAIIIQSINPVNVGLVVKVLSVVGEFNAGDEYTVGDDVIRESIVDGLHWKVGCSANLTNVMGDPIEFGIIPDNWLQPIRGIKISEKTSEDSSVPA
jgi:hypothetical protein